MTKRQTVQLPEGAVTKRCSCDSKDWNLCPHPFLYYVTHKGTKHRGKIPDAAMLDEARAKYLLIVGNIRNGRADLAGLESTGSGPRVSEATAEWLSKSRDRKRTTIDAYRDHVRAQINPAIGSYAVSAVTRRDLEQLVLNAKSTRRKGQELSTKTKRSLAITLHAFLQFCILQGYRTDNPATLLTKVVNDPDASPDVEVLDPNDHTKYFTGEEAQRLLTLARDKFPDWYAFVLTGLQTGMRLGELRGLCYEQINFQAGTLRIDRAWVQGEWTTPKNRKVREFQVSKHLLVTLRAQRRWRRHSKSFPGPDGRACFPVFPSRVGTPLEVSHIDRDWDAMLAAAELGYYRNRHAMRHTHSTLLLQAGVPIARVAAVAGRSIAETEKTYYHWLPKAGGEDAEVMAGILGTAPKAAENGRTHVSSTGAPAAMNRARTATNLRVVAAK